MPPGSGFQVCHSVAGMLDASEAMSAVDSDSLQDLEAALAAIELHSQDSGERAGLVRLAGPLTRRMQRGGASEALAIRLVDVLSTLSRDEAARAEAIDCGCVHTLVGFMCSSRTGHSDNDDAQKLRMAAVKALVNFTQGASKERESVWGCIPALIDLQDPELQRYGLMALANLSTGSEKTVQAKLMQHRIGLAAGNILAAKEMNLPVATQALRVLLPLSTSAHRVTLVQEDVLIGALLAILMDGVPSLGRGKSKTPSERAVAAQVYTASLTLAFNLTGVAREELVEKGLGGAMMRVIKDEAGTQFSSDTGAQHVETALKGLYNLCKGSDACISRVVGDGLLSSAEALLATPPAAASSDSAARAVEGDAEGAARADRLVRCKLLMLRCIARWLSGSSSALPRVFHTDFHSALTRATQRASLHRALLVDSHDVGPTFRRVLSHILLTTPDILSCMDLERAERRGGCDEGDWTGEDDEYGEGEGGGGEGREVEPLSRGSHAGGSVGEGDVLERGLFIVLALSKLSDAGLEWVCAGLVEPLVHVANTCQGRLQGMALGALLLLSRGPPAMRTTLLALPPPRGSKHDASGEHDTRARQTALWYSQETY